MISLSLDTVKHVFQNLANSRDASIQLINIRTSRRTGIGYSSRQVAILPSSRFTQLLTDISNIYAGSGKKSLDHIREVREYDGTTDALTIYKLDVNDKLISEAYSSFLQCIADPNVEDDPFQYNSAYLIRGELNINGDYSQIKLVSMQNPITTLKNKFLHNEGNFYELKEKVLTLRPTMDLLIVNDTVYFLTLSGENLFNMSRAFKAECNRRVDDVKQASIIKGFDKFRTVAESGHHPRQFVRFNESRLDALKHRRFRLDMAKLFKIPLDEKKDKFDADAEGAADKIVKLLCNKGMVDPFENNAVEVDGARAWS